LSTRAATAQPSAPSEQALREAALRHLARYAATEARLLRVLNRRIDRWLRAAREATPDDDRHPDQAAQSREAARRVVAALVASGVVNDTAYAAGRARTLLRAGKSRAKIAQHLALRGIDRTTIRDALPDDGSHDLAAALLLVRKRRLASQTTPEARKRALGILARAGFSHATAQEALNTDPDVAETAIAALRQA
jgi:regulatory protein